MKKKSLLLLTSFLLVLSMFLAACSGNKASNDDNKGNNNTDGSDNGQVEEGPVEGGTLVFAMNSKFEGILDPNFYGNATDADILGFSHEALIKYDENLKAEPHLATWETEDNKVFKFTFEKGVKWHDGNELVVDDWIFALETIAKLGPDHQRWAHVNIIEGAQEFHEGKADSISGLNKLSDYEIEVTFKEAAVN